MGLPQASHRHHRRHNGGDVTTLPLTCSGGWLIGPDGDVTPCPACRPDLHDRWLRGEFAASGCRHGSCCSDCREAA